MIRELGAVILGMGLSFSVFLLTHSLAKTFKKPIPVLDISVWPLLLAPILFVISRYLPTFYEVFNNLTFVQHAVGGGFVSALVFVYIKTALRLQLPVWLQLLALYCVVSVLGVANELLEFGVTQAGLYKVDGSDVWWDLTANTLGAFVAYFIFLAAVRLSREKK